MRWLKIYTASTTWSIIWSAGTYRIHCRSIFKQSYKLHRRGGLRHNFLATAANLAIAYSYCGRKYVIISNMLWRHKTMCSDRTHTTQSINSIVYHFKQPHSPSRSIKTILPNHHYTHITWAQKKNTSASSKLVKKKQARRMLDFFLLIILFVAARFEC